MRIYVYAVRQFADWVGRQPEPVAPTDVEATHIRQFIAELIDKTSAANAHTNYRSLRTFALATHVSDSADSAVLQGMRQIALA